MPNFPCRECDRIRKNEKLVEQKSDAVSPAVSSGEDWTGDAEHPSDQANDASSPPKDRLEVAKEALSAAERQRRFREKDPEAYRKWNRERMRRLRRVSKPSEK